MNGRVLTFPGVDATGLSPRRKRTAKTPSLSEIANNQTSRYHIKGHVFTATTSMLKAGGFFLPGESAGVIRWGKFSCGYELSLDRRAEDGKLLIYQSADHEPWRVDVEAACRWPAEKDFIGGVKHRFRCVWDKCLAMTGSFCLLNNNPDDGEDIRIGCLSCLSDYAWFFSCPTVEVEHKNRAKA